MSHTDDRADKKLPVTAEVGGEGGSFADPTHQVSTFEGDVSNSNGTGDDRVAPDVIESDTAEGMQKYPTDR
jgi:hypothetical protein